MSADILAEIFRRTVKAGERYNTVWFRRHVQTAGMKLDRPTFIKVGANDGLTDDASGPLLLENEKWSGVLIEPVSYCFARLKEKFTADRFKLERCAIGEGVETRFWYVGEEARRARPDLPHWVEMIGSFNRDHVEKAVTRPHVASAFDVRPYIVAETVPVTTLDAIVEKHGMTELTLLHIDAEGSDTDVLTTLTRLQPMILMIEHVHLAQTLKAALAGGLLARGYAVSDCGSDYFALHEDKWGRTIQG